MVTFAKSEIELLARFLAELKRQGVIYEVESDISAFHVTITGF